MATITHDLRTVIAELDARIAQLESNRDRVQATVNDGRKLAINTATLNKINARLQSAYAGRAILMDSCCHSQTCNYEWDPEG